MTKPTFPTDLVTFTEEVLNGKHHFCAVALWSIHFRGVSGSLQFSNFWMGRQFLPELLPNEVEPISLITPTMTFLISYTITNLLMAFIEVLLNFSKSCFFLLRISITFYIPSFPYLHVIDYVNYRRSKVNTREKDGGKRRNSSTTMKGIVTLLNHSFR